MARESIGHSGDRVIAPQRSLSENIRGLFLFYLGSDDTASDRVIPVDMISSALWLLL